MKYEKNFDKVERLIKGNMKSALKEIGHFGAAEAQTRAPVDTGELRRGVGSSVDGNTVSIGATSDYAPHVELGTSRQKAQPYLKPAIYENVDEIQSIINKHFKGGM